MKNIVVIAPHCDDECIGTFEIITNEETPPIILYDPSNSEERRQEALNLKKYTKITKQMFVQSIPQILIDPKTIFYFPHPIYETHPEHRRWGFMGEQLLRQGFNVIFYTTLMNAPFIYECKKSKEKEELLNKIYPSQRSLWEYEKKYTLFSGYCQWLIK